LVLRPSRYNLQHLFAVSIEAVTALTVEIVSIEFAELEMRVAIATATMLSNMNAEVLWLVEVIEKSGSDAGRFFGKHIPEV
jgi:hypothetical protein